MKNAIIAILASLILAGCTSGKHYIIASTGTVLGLEIGQNPASQMYQAKLGYNRAELALVPSNRASGQAGDASTDGGAADTTDVMMELHYANIFSLQSSGIYQRLAVGKQAVSQPGAAIMFAKGRDGQLDPQVAESISKAIASVPDASTGVSALKVPLAERYRTSTESDRTKFNEAARAAGYPTFDDFLIDTATSYEQLEKIRKGLQ